MTRAGVCALHTRSEARKEERPVHKSSASPSLAALPALDSTSNTPSQSSLLRDKQLVLSRFPTRLMFMSSPSCVASRVKSAQLEDHQGLLCGGGDLRALGPGSVARAVAHKGSTPILDMSVLTTAAEATETVHLADSLSASYTQGVFGGRVRNAGS